MNPFVVHFEVETATVLNKNDIHSQLMSNLYRRVCICDKIKNKNKTCYQAFSFKENDIFSQKNPSVL